ncbi:MAG: hypothetical protein JW869_00930 [Candidatus Omnitrophica bacterium]|nr:hypothetical protein [Candidatus Omnitrophota bacterium]
MSQEGYIESYKGQSIMVYGQAEKWNWQVIIFDDNPTFKVDSSAAISPKSYPNKEKAIQGARKHIDRVLKDKKVESNTT